MATQGVSFATAASSARDQLIGWRARAVCGGRDRRRDKRPDQRRHQQDAPAISIAAMPAQHAVTSAEASAMPRRPMPKNTSAMAAASQNRFCGQSREHEIPDDARWLIA